MSNISIEGAIKWYENYNPNKKPSTYSGFKYSLIRIEKIMKTKLADINVSDFNNITAFTNREKEMLCSLNTRIQTNLAMCLLLKYLEDSNLAFNLTKLRDEYGKRLSTLTTKKKEQIEEQGFTKKEKENWIDFDDLKEKFIDYVENQIIDKNIEFTQMRNVLLMAFYVLIPPTRIGNYQFLRLKYQKKATANRLMRKHNYLMINKDKSITLCFNQYKTSKYIGQICRNIENELLIKLIHQYIERRRIKVRHKTNCNFFVNKDDEQMTQTNITDTLKFISKKILGKELSANMFRHIFLTTWGKENHTIQENKQLCDFIGQTYSPNMMEKYKKYDEEEKKPLQGLVLSFD